MNTFYNYIKVIEDKLSAPEIPEAQFLDIELYKSSSFNLKTFSFSIFSKINDTSYLLNQLKLTIERTKNEIVEQINSNYTNYVALISKLQMIDFLIDNIQQSLNNIKNKINGKMNLIDKYENELKGMLNYIQNNDNEINKINEMIKNYENKLKSEKIKKKIEDYLSESVFDKKDIVEKNYTKIRKILFLFIPLYKINMTEEQKYNNIIKMSYKSFGDEFFLNQNNINSNEIKLSLNILYLINKIYVIKGEENEFYKIIFEDYIKTNVIKILESNQELPQKIEELLSYMNNEKLSNLNKTFNNKKFLVVSFLIPFLNKYTIEGTLYNCLDSNQFKDNYLSVLKFISNFYIDDNVFENIKSFIQNFSFFTYFQYIQNEICSKISELIKDDLNYEDLTLLSNCLFNFTKTVQEIFIEKKIFLKNLTNFINFILQCNKFIQIKIKEYENNNENLKIYLQSKNKENLIEMKFDDKIKKVLEEYDNNLKIYNTFFKEDFESKIIEVIEREDFIFQNKEEKENLNKCINTFCENIKENYLNN